MPFHLCTMFSPLVPIWLCVFLNQKVPHHPKIFMLQKMAVQEKEGDTEPFLLLRR